MRVSICAQPKPSAHTMLPPAPTATDNPGRFCSARLARMLRLARLTASDHCGEDSLRLTDDISCASGCSADARTFINTHVPTIDTTRRPIGNKIQPSPRRFRDTSPPIPQSTLLEKVLYVNKRLLGSGKVESSRFAWALPRLLTIPCAKTTLARM